MSCFAAKHYCLTVCSGWLMPAMSVIGLARQPGDKIKQPFFGL
jgi:hypothetical protein